VVGIDPSLEAILAARSIARQLGTTARFVVGDARFLPFRAHCFDVVFSYSVLQHFAKDNVRQALGSIRRVLKDDGVSLIQMLNGIGARSLYNRARMLFAERHPFEVRFWSVRELSDIFSAALGPTKLVVDGFFSANVQRADFHLLPGRFRALVDASDLLRGLTSRFPLLANVADSLYVLSGDNPARVAEIERVLVAR
jgi:SAM-dependent methyltransferase